MADDEPIRVAILAKPQATGRVESLLEGDSRLRVVRGEAVEVVIVDGKAPPLVRDEVRIISLGDSSDADVVLHEPSATELRLACRLLGENVRLRRRLRAADEQRSSLARQAQTDPLTGVANRRAWDEELAARCSAAQTGRTLCLAIADLDHFKAVNDTHGHATGDAVLQATAKALAGAVRQVDFVARLGGDEFGLLLWDLDAATAMAVLERIRVAVPHGLAAASLPSVTTSIGYALATSPVMDGTELFAQADAALCQAKQSGRNRITAGIK